MSTNHLRTAVEEIEVPSWAPWLRFSLDDLRSYERAFPPGQILELADGEVIGMLTSVRVQWGGDVADLTTWDDVAGRTADLGDVSASDGDTMVMLSVSVHPSHRGEGVPARLVETARRVAGDLGLDHLISPFRPSGYGRHKAEGGPIDFAAYVASTRDDGLPADPWLRVLTRLGMTPLGICARAMVVEATPEAVDRWRATYDPTSWVRVEGERAATLRAGLSDLWPGHEPEVWECGETGTWFVDRVGGRAWYVEDNLWGEVPIARSSDDRGARATRDDVVVDVTDATLARERAQEQALVADLVAAFPDEAVAVAWIDPTHPHAEVVRRYEVVAFPDIAAFTPPEVEARCRFLAVVDLAAGEVVHGFRVSSARFGPDVVDDSSSGVPMVDEVVEVNASITLAEVRDRYRRQGVDIATCVAVETNFRVVGGHAPSGLRWSDLGYVAVFLELMVDGVTSGERGVFAHLNEAARQSLRAIGVEAQPFAGDPELRSPASQEGTFDDRYAPAFVPDTDENVAVFQALTALAAPSLRFVAEVDLRDRALSDGAGHQAVEECELQGVDRRGGDGQHPDEAGREA